MGQGAESCGGYEVEYDPYSDGLVDGTWTQRSGASIKIEDMSISHIRNSIRVCEAKAECATFTDEEEMWNDWILVFENELERRGETREAPLAKYTCPSSIKPTRGVKTVMVCHCGTEYEARTADIARGWGLSCSKRCASIRREYGKPSAKPKH